MFSVFVTSVNNNPEKPKVCAAIIVAAQTLVILVFELSLFKNAVAVIILDFYEDAFGQFSVKLI